MEFGIKRCAILIMKEGKREALEGTELRNQERIGTLGEKENSKYMVKLEADTIKQAKIKEKNKKRDSQNQVCSWNLNKGINT